MINNNRIPFYAVDYRYQDGASTFDIFQKLEEAEAFANTFTDHEKCIPTRIWQGDFDAGMVYQESNGAWNYDEYADMVTNEKTIRILNKVLPDNYIIY